MRATRLYINIKKIKANISNIKHYAGKDIEIMPIIKCNAYGTHIDKLIEIAKLFNYVGVALVDEGVSLRKSGYNGKILVLYPPMKEELNNIIKYNLIFNGCDIDVLEYYSKKAKKPLTIHIEVETGMGRTGIQIKNIASYIEQLKKLKNVKVDGVYSHLSSSSSDLKFTKDQIIKFKRALKVFDDSSVTYEYTHIFNSGALLNFKDKKFNMVRVGLLIYGYYPNKKSKKIIKVYPSMTLKTSITFIKEIDINDTVGYNKNFIAERKSIIATIPFGFGDGLIGLDTGEPYVILKGKKAKIVGICMDNMMIDITDIPDVKIGDEVIIFDDKQLTVEKVADWCNGICNYEVISSLSDRIPRIFI